MFDRVKGIVTIGGAFNFLHRYYTQFKHLLPKQVLDKSQDQNCFTPPFWQYGPIMKRFPCRVYRIWLIWKRVKRSLSNTLALATFQCQSCLPSRAWRLRWHLVGPTCPSTLGPSVVSMVWRYVHLSSFLHSPLRHRWPEWIQDKPFEHQLVDLCLEKRSHHKY